MTPALGDKLHALQDWGLFKRHWPVIVIRVDQRGIRVRTQDGRHYQFNLQGRLLDYHTGELITYLEPIT